MKFRDICSSILDFMYECIKDTDKYEWYLLVIIGMLGCIIGLI